ncbi:hypothetical protein FGG08_002455 [Glutinoglossum americanum]|uniref:Ribosomal RNA-processing protein 43 n=1 Tax=Glutinoglossum americanum TaxID=1670608 RepID=A0A9P8IF36_9PEZI|nr:hypothetical protein FGG08_002455 [Glutinoglossum americanum]
MAASKPPSPAISPPSLSFPRATFAKLSPHPFLLAHLQPPTPPSANTTPPHRPNGRLPTQFRPPNLHTGSLTHASGSSVVRLGDTAVVCGIRAEILPASNVGCAYTCGGSDDDTEIQALGLLVPNVELSTGCSPAHLPGQPPSPLAQTLAARLQSLLYATNLIGADELRIMYVSPPADDAGEGGGAEEVKAWWTLYIDILFISLDGNPFDAAWASLLLALKDTRLPLAYWDPDLACVLCDDLVANAKRLRMRRWPVASTFAVYSAQERGSVGGDGAGKWILADPDAFEEGLCRESVTVVVDCEEAEGGGVKTRIVRLEKRGGGSAGKAEIKEVVEMATERWRVWRDVLKGNA